MEKRKYKNGFFASWERIINNDDRDRELNKRKLTGNYLIPDFSTLPDDGEKKVCVDIGAAQGYFAIQNEEYFDEIYCFEPCYPNFLKLIRNVQEKNLINKITCLNLALSKSRKSADGTGIDGKIIDFKFNNRSSPYGSSIVDNIEKSKDHSHSVIAIGLPQVFKFVSRDKIDYLKCDIEGAEYGLLFGEKLSNIGIISMEVHRQILGKANVKELIHYITKQGFSPVQTSQRPNGEFTFINRGFWLDKLTPAEAVDFLSRHRK